MWKFQRNEVFNKRNAFKLWVYETVKLLSRYDNVRAAIKTLQRVVKNRQREFYRNYKVAQMDGYKKKKLISRLTGIFYNCGVRFWYVKWKFQWEIGKK